MESESHSQIGWRDWSGQAFAQAVAEDKLVLLDIGAVWCHWCHVMDRTTYSDPEVVRTINERFIPIKVDADKHPDVQDRYLLGGWPTTAVLVPDGRILTGSTYLPRDSMLKMLRESDHLYHEDRTAVTIHLAASEQLAEAEDEEEITIGALPGIEALGSLEAALKREFDPENGGFGAAPKFPYPDAIRFAFLQYRRTNDPEMLDIALRTLNGMMGISDPVWGGFYRYSVNDQWTEPHYEKMLYGQAGAVDNYLEAYQVTGEDQYGETASGIKAYVERFLSDREKGGFYGSQDADIGGHDPDAEFMAGEDYFPRDEDERLKIGTPYVDRTVYTDWNGMMSSSYFRLYQVTGDEHARDFAVRTIDRLLDENMCGDCMCHYFDGEARLPGLLSDQVYFAQALIDAYQTTGTRRYLSEARKLAGFMETHLQDTEDGGFYYQPYDPDAIGVLKERRTPFDENVAAAAMYTELFYLTGDEAYHRLAGRTLQAVAHPELVNSILGAGFGLALDLYLNYPVHIVVVGDRDDRQVHDMLESSLHAYEPRKLVQVLDPDEDPLTIGSITYEADNEPAAYVCVQNVCMAPVKGNDNLVAVLEDVLGGTPS